MILCKVKRAEVFRKELWIVENESLLEWTWNVRRKFILSKSFLGICWDEGTRNQIENDAETENHEKMNDFDFSLFDFKLFSQNCNSYSPILPRCIRNKKMRMLRNNSNIIINITSEMYRINKAPEKHTLNANIKVGHRKYVERV